MDSKEELESKKYSELIKILKSFDIKFERQKKAKIIELIIEAQNKKINKSKDSAEEFNHSSSNDTVDSPSDEKGKRSLITRSGRRLVTRSSLSEPLSPQPASSHPPKSDEKRQANPSLWKRRSSAFSKESKENNKRPASTSPQLDAKRPHRSTSKSPQSSPLNRALVAQASSPVKNIQESSHSPKKTLGSPQVTKKKSRSPIGPNKASGSTQDVRKSRGSPKEAKRSLNRTDTFVNSPSKRRSLTSIVGNTTISYEDLDLQCKEFQTAEDIEMLENIPSPDSSLVDFMDSSPFRSKKSNRRSLRGQLLEVRASNAFHHAAVVSDSQLVNHLSTPALAPVPEPEIETRDVPGPQKDSGNKAAKGAKSDALNALSSTAKKTAKAPAGPSAIPRFVPHTGRGHVKVPNFAKIHENAFRRMEALDEYVERKQNKLDSVKKDKRDVMKTTSARKLQDKKSSALSPSQQNFLTHGSSFSEAKMTTKSSTDAKFRLKAHKKPSALPKLVKENLPPKAKKDLNITWNKSSPKESPGSYFRRKAYVPSVEKGRSSSSFRASLTKRPSPGLAYKAESKTDRFKKMAQRQPNVKTSSIKAAQKSLIKGVRSNRRFELQMANRGIKM